MEGCQREPLAVADIVQPRGIFERGPPVWFDELNDEANSCSHGGRVAEPCVESPRSLAGMAAASDCSRTGMPRRWLVTPARRNLHRIAIRP